MPFINKSAAFLSLSSLSDTISFLQPSPLIYSPHHFIIFIPAIPLQPPIVLIFLLSMLFAWSLDESVDTLSSVRSIICNDLFCYKVIVHVVSLIVAIFWPGILGPKLLVTTSTLISLRSFYFKSILLLYLLTGTWYEARRCGRGCWSKSLRCGEFQICVVSVPLKQ